MIYELCSWQLLVIYEKISEGEIKFLKIYENLQYTNILLYTTMLLYTNILLYTTFEVYTNF
jgi:hypothetical protein